MRRIRVRWLASLSLFLLLGLVPWLTSGCNGCCPTQPIPPQPGPDIDTTVGGGNTLDYQKNTVAITATNSASKLDPDFFLKVPDPPRVQLMHTTTFRQWNVNQFEVHFADGRHFEAVRQPDQTIKWTCYDSSNTATVLIQGVESDGVPDCMRGTTDNDMIKSTQGSVQLVGNWAHMETVRP